MAEGAQTCFPDGALCNLGKHRVPQFTKCLRQHPGDAITDQQGDGYDNHRIHGRRDRIDGVLVDDGDGDRDAFGRRQKNQRDDYTHPHFRGVLGPQIGQQRTDGL